ncbi:MAG: gamma carbonic anhydrase family protein [Gammaproteobacteria bacterium]
MSIRTFAEFTPTIHDTAFIDPTAVLIGQVSVAREAFVLPMVVARGDVNSISIGAHTNVQDGSILHVNSDSPIQPGGSPLNIGEYVTVGHQVLLHGCTIGNNCLIGMSATVMDMVVIEDNVMVAAGSLITPGKHLESGFLYAGSPAKQVRELKPIDYDMIKYSAEHYSKLKSAHQKAAQNTA